MERDSRAPEAGEAARPGTVARLDARTADRQRTARRALLLGAIVSVLFHLLATMTLRFRIDVIEPRARSIEIVEPSEQYAGTRVYDIVPVEGEAAPIETQLRTPVQDAVVPAAPAGVAQPGDAPAAGGTRRTVDPVGDRLRPRLGHAQVWTEPDATLPELTPDEIVRARVASRLTEINDSMRLDAEREERATDWTVRDGSGGRWGVSPGKIHLGNVTIPAPIALATPPGRREEVNARIVQWNELQQQAQREAVRQMFDERVRAVRERREAERDSTGAVRPVTRGGGAQDPPERR
jgi:hypothetical protein